MIEYRITAVPSRDEYVKKILSVVSADVFWDEERKGCRWNTTHAWEKPVRDGVTHVCIIQDDALLVENFAQATNLCASMFPDAVWSFNVNDFSWVGDTPYVQLVAYNIRGTCVMMPVEHISSYLGFYDEYLYGVKNFDTQFVDAQMRMWACMNQKRVMTTVPQLSAPRDVPSEMTRHRRKKPPASWRGDGAVDLTRFKTLRFEKVYHHRQTCLETHLQKTHPVHVMVEKEYKKQRLLGR